MSKFNLSTDILTWFDATKWVTFLCVKVRLLKSEWLAAMSVHYKYISQNWVKEEKTSHKTSIFKLVWCLVTYFMLISNLKFTIYHVPYFKTQSWYHYIHRSRPSNFNVTFLYMQYFANLLRISSPFISWYIKYQNFKMTILKTV